MTPKPNPTTASSGDAWTVRRILEWTTSYLKQQGSETPRLDTEILLAHARQCRRIDLYTHYEDPLSDSERATMRGLVQRRGQAEPVAYLVGHREFFSLDFAVTPAVLIPRPETEQVVMQVLDAARTRPAPRILDLCTGTGCVAVAVAVNLPGAQITAVDIREEALEICRKNAAAHSVDDRVRVLAGDLYAPLAEGETFDVIAANPPYVTTGELAELDDDVRLHEPHGALDGGADGLDVVRPLVAGAAAFLVPGGTLVVELARAQTGTVAEMLEATDNFEKIDILKDASGHPRVVEARKRSIG